MSPRLSPSPLPLLHEERERGGERSSGDPAPASVNDTEDTEATTTPLSQRGSGVGGEGRTERWPPTPWLPEHGTFPRRNPGV